MNKDSKIYVAGHKGLVGSSIIRLLEREGYQNIITATKKELDLTNQVAVKEFFAQHKPEYVFLAAAKVGGIKANDDYPADFFYINSMIENNVIHQAYEQGVKKLLFLGSSCIYPRDCKQPIKEENLLTGPLEKTNEAYAIAKISGLKMCQYYRRQYGCNFISAMPTNLYGPNDNYDLETSHVLPAFILRFHEAKVNNAPFVELWGTGTPRREFLYVDDLAEALLFLMENYDGEEHINVGVGEDLTIKELAYLVAKVIGYEGEIRWDATKPDGTLQKLLDISKIKKLGWRANWNLSDGIRTSYDYYSLGKAK